MDAPRDLFQRVVTLAPDARGKHRARWLVGDVARLVVQTLEDGEARPARLALQLCARLVAHDYADGADARPHGNDVVDAGESDDDDAAHRLREGDQVLVYAAKLWEGPRSGVRCVSARGDRVDVRMDRGGAFADVPVVAEAPLKGEAPVARPATAAPAGLREPVPAPRAPPRAPGPRPGEAGPGGRADARRDVRLRRGPGRDGEARGSRSATRGRPARSSRPWRPCARGSSPGSRRAPRRDERDGAPVPAPARRRAHGAPRQAARAAGRRRVPPPPRAAVVRRPGEGRADGRVRASAGRTPAKRSTTPAATSIAP